MITDIQKAERRNGIGGSDAAAVCGLSRYKTPLQVYYEKVEGLEVEQSPRMYWGNKHEANVADEYKIQTKKKLFSPSKALIHPDYDFIRGNVDGVIINENGLLECKTTESFNLDDWGVPGTDEIPTEYLLQCAHYSMIFGHIEYVDVAVLIGLSDFRIYRYTKDKKMENDLLEQEINFWQNHVLKQIPPDPVTLEDVKLRWKNHRENNFVTSSDEIEYKIESLKILKETIKGFEAQKDEMELEIKKYIKDAEGLKNDRGKVLATWKTQETNRLDTNLLKIQQPEIFKEFTKTSSSRVFLLKK